MTEPLLPLVERILDCVGSIPAGAVLAYGDVAELAGGGSGRVVGRALALRGGEVPWHRVVRADGSCAPPVRAEQLRRLRAEGVPLVGERVQMDLARWDGTGAP